MADGQGYQMYPASGYGPGQHLGTASAPVSRSHSAAEGEPSSTMTHQRDPSPPSSSENTAVNGNTPGVRFASEVQDAGVSASTSAGAAPPASHVPDISLPAPQTEEQLRRALGSASAPASPGDGSGHQAFSPLKKSETLPDDHITTTSAQQHGISPPGLFASEQRNHADPAVAAGILHPSEADPNAASYKTATNTNINSGSRSAPHSKKGSRSHSPNGGGRHSPHTAKWPHAFNFPMHYSHHSYSGRGSHQDQHSKPLYSLARPLPTREQRDMQKAYRDSIKAHVGPGSKHHSATTSRNPSSVNLVGPGAHHPPYYPYIAPLAPLPHERGGSRYLEPGLPEGRHPGGTGTFGGVQSNDQIMLMLQQILRQQQTGGKPTGLEGTSKVMDGDAPAADGDIRDTDDPDAALARKEGFGQGKDKKDAIKEKTSRAERRDSISSSDASSYSDESESEYPNPWARFRHAMREPFAEFLGTMLLVMFGTGVSLQYFLSLDPNVVSSPRGTYLSVSFGWGIGVGIGVWVAGGISGGHINPAVTLSLAAFRGFPWKKVPGYILAQCLGSMAGAGMNYAMYRRAISIFEGGGNIRTISGPSATASLFSTYPLDYVTDANAFFQEFIDTAILLITVLAISDSNNAAPPDGLNPLVLLFLVVGIGACFGMQTAYCINPARDIGPRLVTWFAGYGKDVWDFRNQYWLWVPWCATISGGLFGCVIYDMLIYTGSESPVNMKWDWWWRKKDREGFGPASKQKMPLGQTEA